MRESTGHRHRPAIDPLFRSAAAEYGPRVIGVILSGAQHDGIAGLTEVVENGGVAIVQDPATAVHDSMPRAALRRGAVRHVLRPEGIGGVIVELVAYPRGGEPPAGGHEPA